MMGKTPKNLDKIHSPDQTEASIEGVGKKSAADEIKTASHRSGGAKEQKTRGST